MPSLKSVFERPDCVLAKSYRMQLLVTLAVNLITFSHGVAIGWLSPTLTQFGTDKSPLDFSLEVEEVSWIGSLIGLGSLVGNISFGVILTYFGHKFSLYALAIPQIGLWMLIYFAKSVEYLYVARFLGGVSGGGGYVVLPIFVSEIADSRIRGTLSSIVILSVNLGILIGYILSSFLTYHTVPCIIVAFPVLFFISVFLFPGTPQLYLRQGRIECAERALRFYKNVGEKANFLELRKFQEDFDELKSIAKENQEKLVQVHIGDFTSRETIKGFITAMVILLVNQFSGCFAFVNYMSTIFQESSSNMDPNTATVIVGLVQIFGAYSATLFVDRFGRKLLMLLSTAGCSIILVMFGFFTFFAKNGQLQGFDWIPVLLMAFFVFICNMGIVALTFILIVELFPAKIRSIATSACMSVLSFLVFVVLKAFPLYLDHFGISVTMWSSAVITAASFVYFLIFLKETKGKSMNH